MGRVRDIRNARRLHEEFREKPVGRKRRVKIDVPKAMMVMGRVEFIGYNTTHGTRAVPYTHEFQPGSKPYLVAGPGRGQLFLVGKNFRVTRRGIVDTDAAGRPKKEVTRYKVIRIR